MKERFQPMVFRRLMLAYTAQALAFSITSMVDSAFAGQYYAMGGLVAMKLASPVFSVLGLFSHTLSGGLSIRVRKE